LGIEKWVNVDGVVVQGHGIASGRNPHSPYPAGSIELQKPFFKELGLDLAAYFDGTLNVSIRPYTFTLANPQYTFRQVNWIDVIPPEDFSFSQCKVIYEDKTYDSLIYYPHPETKIHHFHDPSILEILAPHIPHIMYGDKTHLLLNPHEITLINPLNPCNQVIG
jgi:hypothetical protein